MQYAEWGPRTAGIAGCAVLGGALALSCVTLAADAPGRILTGIAAAGLIVFAGVSWRARPKLAMTPDGLVLRGWRRSQLVRRPDITNIRITEFRRTGRKVRLLEVEATGDRLLVFTRWDLGTNPLAVLDSLTAAGYAGRRSGRC